MTTSDRERTPLSLFHCARLHVYLSDKMTGLGELGLKGCAFVISINLSKLLGAVPAYASSNNCLEVAVLLTPASTESAVKFLILTIVENDISLEFQLLFPFYCK